MYRYKFQKLVTKYLNMLWQNSEPTEYFSQHFKYVDKRSLCVASIVFEPLLDFNNKIYFQLNSLPLAIDQHAPLRTSSYGDTAAQSGVEAGQCIICIYPFMVC